MVPCGVLEDPNYRADDVDPYEPVIEVGTPKGSERLEVSSKIPRVFVEPPWLSRRFM